MPTAKAAMGRDARKTPRPSDRVDIASVPPVVYGSSTRPGLLATGTHAPSAARSWRVLSLGAIGCGKDERA
jgi:hypothetical protein